MDQHAKQLLIDYRKAHLAWKEAPDGPEKVEAKRKRGQLHGKVLELAELLDAKPER